MISVPQPQSTADTSTCTESSSYRLSNYRQQLYPWCLVRLLPKLQRITVARFRHRNEAEEHYKVLRRLIPQASFVIVFEPPAIAE